MHTVLSRLSNSYIAHYFSEHLFQLLLVSIVTYLVFKYVQESFLRNLPPGPIGLPFVGYRPLLGDRPQMKLAELSESYGGIISVRLGPTLTVVINDYAILKETFCNPLALDRNKAAFEHALDSGFAIANGEEWEEQRRFCMQTARDLGLGRGQWEDMIQEEVSSFVEELKSYNGKPKDIADQLATTVNNNVLSLLIGRRLQKGTDDRKMKLASDFNYSAVNFMAAHSVVAMMPKLRKFLEWLKIGGFDRAAKAVSDFTSLIRQEVQKHRFDVEFKSANDFINLYLNKMDAVTVQNAKHTFSDKNLEGNVKVLFLGGADTVFVSLNWLFRFMAAYPEIQKKVHEELDDVIGRDGKISYEERFKIPYTFAVLMEAQRYSSTAPLPIRMAREDFTVRGYTIPKGIQLLGNLWAIHHDPKHWKQPEKFNPERFLSEDKKKFLSNLPGFVAFSVGRRNCPGETVAWMEILAYFAAVMQSFNISMPPGVEPKFEVNKGLISRLKPQPLCFVERK